MENIVTQYWPQLTAFVMVVIVLARMKTDIDILKDKVKTLFDLWNKEK
jgi:hypothetical protein